MMGMRRALPLAIVAVLFLTTLAFADADANAARISEIISKTSVAYVAVGVSILIAVLLYMGSSLFQDPRMSAQAKDTLYQSIASLIIIASLPALYLVVSNIVTEILLGDMQVEGDMFDVAEMFLLWNQLFFFVNLIITTIINVFVSQTINQNYPVPLGMGRVISVSLMTFAKPIIAGMQMAVNMVSIGIMVNGFQLLFLNFIKQSVLPLFLPIGVIMRAFNPTVHAGNVLIAISIGAYIITPAVFAFDVYLLSGLVSDNSAAGTLDDIGLLGLFYTEDMLKGLVGSTGCPYVKALLTAFQKDYSIFEYSSEDKPSAYDLIVGGSGGKCSNIELSSMIYASIGDVPTWAKVAIGSKATSMAASLGASILNKITTWKGSSAGKLSKIAPALQWFSLYSTAVASIAMTYYMFNIIYGVGTSFVILVAIIPFINFTIIVMFMREFSQVVLGTPLNLSHLLRLI